ncbi:interferon beta-like [Pogona vitticeps]
MIFLYTELPQGCSQLQSKLREANKKNLELLNGNMGSAVPRACLSDTVNFFSKPNKESLQIIRECREKNATEAIYEILRQIVLLFGQNHTQLSWDEDSTTVFELGLDHEIGILGPCLRSGMAPLNIKQGVMKYFEQINQHLKYKKYSLCAWEVAQIEVKQCLILIDQLIKKLPNEDPPAINTLMKEQLDAIAMPKEPSDPSAFSGFFL